MFNLEAFCNMSLFSSCMFKIRTQAKLNRLLRWIYIIFIKEAAVDLLRSAFYGGQHLVKKGWVTRRARDSESLLSPDLFVQAFGQFCISLNMLFITICVVRSSDRRYCTKINSRQMIRYSSVSVEEYSLSPVYTHSIVET